MSCSVFAFSQEIKFGAKAGLNSPNLRSDYPTGIDEHNSKNSFSYWRLCRIWNKRQIYITT